MQYLHEERHVIHCDIKPANVLLKWKLKDLGSLVTYEDYSKALHLQPGILEVKLGDFGFAQGMSLSGGTTVQQGSPYYMAPELFSETSVTHKADIWSLGVLLYEILVS